MIDLIRFDHRQGMVPAAVLWGSLANTVYAGFPQASPLPFREVYKIYQLNNQRSMSVL